MRRLLALINTMVALACFLVSGKAVADTFLDTFSSLSYSNQNGSHNWSSSWSENGDDFFGWPFAGEIQIQIFPGRLRLQDNNKSISRSANLSIYATATLSFDYQEVGFDNDFDNVSIEVRAGGSGSWTTLATFANSSIGSGSASYDISTYINTVTEIRFVTSTSSAMNSNDVFYIDNVQIEAFAGPTTPVAEYYFDEASWNGSSNEVLDSSGSGLDGSSNGASTIADGQICRAGNFNGSSDYLTVNGIDSYLRTTATLSFWVNTTQTGNNTNWLAPGVAGIEQSGGADDIFWGWIDAAGRIGVTVGNGPHAKSTTIINDGTWHHIVQTRNAITGELQTYVDGVLESTTNGNTGVIGNGFSSIGRIEDTAGTHTYYAGELDEIVIFNAVLDTAQVQSIYNNQLAGNNWDGSARVCSVLPSPVAEWRMDEFAWSGTTGEVIDSSGNSNNATALQVASGVRTIANGFICRAATFPDISSDTSHAVNTGVTVSSAIGGQGSLSLWHRSTVAWTSTGSDKTLWDASSAGSDNKYFYLILLADGRLRFGMEDPSDGDYRIETSSPLSIAANTWAHVVVNWDVGGSTQAQIWVNGVQQAVTTTVNTLSGSALGNTYTLYIGDNRSTYYPNGSNRAAAGDIDEVLLFDQALTGTQINEIRTLQSGGMNLDGTTRICATTGPDHYVITTSPTAVTCEPLIVTVSAVDGGGNPMDIPAGTILTLSTDIANDGWSNPGGAGATYTVTADTATVEFALRKLMPATLEIDVDDNNGVTDDDGNRNDDTVVFTDAGLRFYADGTVDNIGIQVSGKPSNVAPDNQTITIKAVQSSPTDPGVCEALITNSTQDIRFAYRCDNPGSCATANGALTINATAVNSNATTPYTNVSISFDSSGLGTFIFDYDDAGFITLLADADLPVSGSGGGTANVQGGSNSFLVKPAGFCVQAQDMDGAGPNSPACSSSPLSDCFPYVSVDSDFSLDITAVAWESSSDTDLCSGNAPTPNFSSSNITLTHALLAPSPGAGVTLGSVAPSSPISISIGAGGTTTVTNTQLSEVGVFTITATDGDYFFQIPPISISGTSDNIGRLVPHHYVVESTFVTPAIGSFTYLGQPFLVQFDIRAVDSDGETTSNYRVDDAGNNNFIKLDVDAQISYGAVDSTPTYLTTRLSAASITPAWGNGTISAVIVPLTLARDPLIVEAPLTVDVGLVLTDSDGVTLDPSALDLDTEGPVANDRQRIGSASEFRYGRAFVPPVYGPEVPVDITVTTPIPFVAQYWNGTSFVTSTDDSVSRYDAWSELNCADGSVSCGDVTFVAAPAGADVISGLSDRNESMAISRPGYPGDLQLQIDVDDWFQYDWTTPGTDEGPTTTITFGTYRGHDRIIYWRELH